MPTPRRCQHSCESAAQTREWMSAIADFIRPHRALIDAHVVNFFRDRLWETVDEEWIQCLRKEPVKNLLNIPSGVAMKHWPASLQQFMASLNFLVISREPESLEEVFPNFRVKPLGSVVSQGMNVKKKHEVEALSAVIGAVADLVGAQTVIDVGSGQGYLAQVLSFEYELSVIAIDASSHHSTVTTSRAARIRKHYEGKLRKSPNSANKRLNVPRTVTCDILSSGMLSAVSATAMSVNDQASGLTDIDEGSRFRISNPDIGEENSCTHSYNSTSAVVLAGLHACGDLTANMLRTFVECEQVKALVSIGCCYNLLTERCSYNSSMGHCFPMSTGAKSTDIIFGKSARDLACQSADRWRSLSELAALQNFDLHAFRAAFQMVLEKHYPNVLNSSPTIGRQGKALRRQQLRRTLQGDIDVPSVALEEHQEMAFSLLSLKSQDVGMATVFEQRTQASTIRISVPKRQDEIARKNLLEKPDKNALFEEFCISGFKRLGSEIPTGYLRVWEEVQPFVELIGPFWCLRASFGPLLETYLLLDRLLYLQEQACSKEVKLIPLFDPVLSPRNVAIIAKK